MSNINASLVVVVWPVSTAQISVTIVVGGAKVIDWLVGLGVDTNGSIVVVSNPPSSLEVITSWDLQVSNISPCTHTLGCDKDFNIF